MAGRNQGKLWDERDWIDITSRPNIIANPADESTSSISTGVNAAWQYAMEQGKTLVGPPRDCTILVNATILGRDYAPALNQNHFPYGKPRIMAYPGTRLTFKLHSSVAGTAAFPDDAETAVMRVFQQAATGGETNTVAYLHVVSGITIDTNGVYGAFGFDLGGHQHCLAEDLEVIATGSAGGFGRLYGPGSVNRNIKVTGGRNPIFFRQRPGSGTAVVGCTIAGLDIVNPEGPILIQGARASTNITGMTILTDSTAAPIEIVANAGAAAENSLTGHLELFRCHIEYTGVATTATAIDNTGNRTVSLTDCQFRKINTIVNNLGVDLAGSNNQYHYIREYKYTPTSLNGLTGYKLIDGARTAGSTITHADNATSATPVANLVESVRVATPNFCDETQWHWLDEPWNGQPGITPEAVPRKIGGVGEPANISTTINNTSRINTIFTEATAAKKRIYQPSGLWGIGAPLTPPTDAVRMSGRGGTSVLCVTEEWRLGATSQAYMIDWPDDANAKYQDWYGSFETGSARQGCWIGAYRWRGGANTVMIAGKLDINANRHYDRAKNLCDFSANAGGRIYGWVDHARINRTTSTGPVSFAAGFKQINVSAASQPIMFIGFNPELIPGNTSAPWPSGTPTETVVFSRYANAIIFGSKWESTASAMLSLSGSSGDNLYVSGYHAWANSQVGADAPLVKMVSPAPANIGLMLGYNPNYTQTGEFVNATGYSSGYGAGNTVLRQSQFVSSLRQGAQFDPSGLPKTFLVPDAPVVGNRMDPPDIEWVQVIWWSALQDEVSGFAQLRLTAPGSATNLATDNAKLYASGVTNKNNLTDSDDATVATATGQGSVKYDLASASTALGQVILRVSSTTNQPYRVLVLARRADTGKVRTLADLRNPVWVTGQDYVIDATAVFGESSIWTTAAYTQARALM